MTCVGPLGAKLSAITQIPYSYGETKMAKKSLIEILIENALESDDPKVQAAGEAAQILTEPFSAGKAAKPGKAAKGKKSKDEDEDEEDEEDDADWG